MPKYNAKLSETELEMIEGMAGLGLSHEKIAQVLKVSYATFVRMLKGNAALRKRMDVARATVSAKAYQSLFSRATESRQIKKRKYEMVGDKRKLVEEQEIEVAPSDSLLQFWCNTREDFKVKTSMEVSGPDGKPIEVMELTDEERQAKLKRLRHINDIE